MSKDIFSRVFLAEHLRDAHPLILEAWQVFEVSTDAPSGLSALGSLQDRVMHYGVRDRAVVNAAIASLRHEKRTAMEVAS